LIPFTTKLVRKSVQFATEEFLPLMENAMKNTDAKSMIVSTAKEELKIPENVLDAKMDSPSNKIHLEMFVLNNLIKPKIVKFSIYTTTANNVV
jgi:hypothetical protein